MSHKPSPEPWDQYGYIIYSPGHGVICELSELRPKDKELRHHRVEFGSPDLEEIMANGRLIVLAPKLLKRCNAFLNWLASEGTNLDGLSELISDIREVVKEIGGEDEGE